MAAKLIARVSNDEALKGVFWNGLSEMIFELACFSLHQIDNHLRERNFPATSSPCM